MGLATALNGTDEQSDPEPEDEQIQDHLDRDQASRELTRG
jgi:hypothetical protein